MMPEMAGIAGYASTFIVMALINGVACLGLNLQWGQTGLFNVGVAGFVAIGAYTSALVTTAAVDGRLGGFGAPIAIGWLAAMLVAGAASAAVGAATLRLRSDYLAITTFGAAVVVELIARNAGHLTGGSFGIAFIPRPFEALAERPTLFSLTMLLLVSSVALLVYVALERLVRSPWGRVLRAIREDERAAASLGKNATQHRLQAFALGGALMGLAGALEAHVIGFISPENFQANLTFQVWAMLIVGGSGNNLGALVGAAVVSAIWSLSGLATGVFFPAEEQARAAALRIVAIGVLLAATIGWRPRGLMGERAVVSRHLDGTG
jgi:branched-chain amino acid transport system permease protein